MSFIKKIFIFGFGFFLGIIALALFIGITESIYGANPFNMEDMLPPLI